MKIRLSDKAAGKLKPGSKKFDVRDEGCRGLMLVVYTNGSKVFAARPRIGEKRPWVELGHFCLDGGRRTGECISTTDARARHDEMRVMIARGDHPLVKEARGENLGVHFGAVANRYLKIGTASKADSTITEETRIIRRDILPAIVEGKPLEEMPVDLITPRHIAAVVEPIVARGKITAARRARSVLSIIMSYAKDQEQLIQMNPVWHYKRPGKEVPRDRFLSDTEVKALWESCEVGAPPRAAGFREPPETAAIIQLALLTLARRKELMLMEWANIDQRERVWTMPAEITIEEKRQKVVKNGKMHQVPLCPLAWSVLERVRPMTGSCRWVFPRWDRPDLPRATLQKGWRKYRNAAGIDCHFHDLRATGATLLARLGIREDIVRIALNHSTTGALRVYLREKIRYAGEHRQALEKLGGFVERLIADESSVLPFTQHRSPR